MEFSFTDEQEEFRTVLRRFLESKSPTTEVRRVMETDEGCDAEVWKQLSEELGLPGIHIPEAYGGQGFGFVELSIILEEMGRSLLCAPYFASTVLAGTAILNAASEDQKKDLLPGIASGATLATLAFTEANGLWDASGIEMTATSDGGAHRLSGEKSFVVDGHTAGLIVVVARAPGTSGSEGLSFFAVDGDASGLSRQALASMDPTRKLAKLTFDATPATLLGNEGAGGPAFELTLAQAAIALANEMAGGAERLLESAVEYTQMRMQFGRAIGSFQAIKHKLADMLLDVELAKSAAYGAAQAAAEGSDETGALASLAKAALSDAYLQTAANTIQLHGGIGFTWDNDTHLWFKRAKSSEVLLGDATYHRELLMQRWDV